VRGVDLTDALLSESVPEVDRQIYCESLTPTKYNANSLLGLVTRRWKYIQTTRLELYDLHGDPLETQNLADAEVEIAQRLQDHLEEIIDNQVRQLEDRTLSPGADAIRQLESLGYVGGAVSEDLSFDQTKEDPKDAIKLHHSNSKLMALISEKKYDRATQLGAEIVQEHPNYIMAHIHMARIAMDQHDMARALVHLKRALKISPGDADTHDDMGLVLVDLGKTDEAVDHYQPALAARPDAPPRRTRPSAWPWRLRANWMKRFIITAQHLRRIQS
jgi:tetratricopeptide (TPR) repeat protein